MQLLAHGAEHGSDIRAMGGGASRLQKPTKSSSSRPPKTCPDCGGALQEQGCRERTILEVEPLRRKTTHCQLEQEYCPRCRRKVRPRPPGVFKKSLLINLLLAHVAVQHYFFGVTLGQLEIQLGVRNGSLHGAMHQLAEWLAPACDRLLRHRLPTRPEDT